MGLYTACHRGECPESSVARLYKRSGVICSKETIGGIFCATVGFIWRNSPNRLLPDVVISVQNDVDCWFPGVFCRLRRQRCRRLSRLAVVSAG
jgi:hypothetical protein